jgi:hypothetical protein
LCTIYSQTYYCVCHAPHMWGYLCTHCSLPVPRTKNQSVPYEDTSRLPVNIVATAPFSSIVFGGRGGAPPTQATAQALAAGPRVILLALYHGGQAFTPHALACFICQLNPHQKHLNPIPEVVFFDPMPAFCCWRAALRVGVACSARWPVVLARKLWAQTQTPTHPEPKHNHRH